MNDESTTPMDPGLQRMIKAHLWYGGAGLILGLAAALAFVTWGPEYLRVSPLFTTIAFAIVGTIGLSMAGGLMTFWFVPEAATE